LVAEIGESTTVPMRWVRLSEAAARYFAVRIVTRSQVAREKYAVEQLFMDLVGDRWIDTITLEQIEGYKPHVSQGRAGQTAKGYLLDLKRLEQRTGSILAIPTCSHWLPDPATCATSTSPCPFHFSEIPREQKEVRD